jgi:hypothetical protein
MQVNDLVPKTSDLDHIFESDLDNDDAVSIPIDGINITRLNILICVYTLYYILSGELKFSSGK